MIQGFKTTPKTKTPKPPLQPIDSTGREFCDPPPIDKDYTPH